jgi:hypothetical protein
MKNIAIGLLLSLVAFGGVSCVSTGENEHGVVVIEEMSDQDFNKWKLYLQLGVKIGMNRLIVNETISVEDAELVAETLKDVATNPVIGGVENLLTEALKNNGFTNDEALLVILIVEQEILARNGFDLGIGGTLSPRTQDLLLTISNAVRDATIVTDEELRMAEVNGAIHFTSK